MSFTVFVYVTGLQPLTLMALPHKGLVPNGTLHVYLCKQQPSGQKNHKSDQTLSNAHQYSMHAAAFTEITFQSYIFLTLHTNVATKKKQMAKTPNLYIYLTSSATKNMSCMHVMFLIPFKHFKDDLKQIHRCLTVYVGQHQEGFPLKG